MSFELRAGEEVLLKKAANHFRGIEAAGGKLRVTNQRLHFGAHGINLQREPLEIPLAEIDVLKLTNTYGLIPNGLTVVLRDGREERFVLWGRDRVIAAVAPFLAESHPEPAATGAGTPNQSKGGYCAKCGAPLRCDAVFCERCGERVAATKESS